MSHKERGSLPQHTLFWHFLFSICLCPHLPPCSRPRRMLSSLGMTLCKGLWQRKKGCIAPVRHAISLQMSGTGEKRNTFKVFSSDTLGPTPKHRCPVLLPTLPPPYFFTTVKATLNRACKDTVSALETQNLSPSQWGEKEIALLRFLASSSLRKTPLSTNPNQ